MSIIKDYINSKYFEVVEKVGSANKEIFKVTRCPNCGLAYESYTKYINNKKVIQQWNYISFGNIPMKVKEICPVCLARREGKKIHTVIKDELYHIYIDK